MSNLPPLPQDEKALTGLSTNEYVRKIRMKHAEQYLLEGKYNISEIAFKVGINNLFYFRQCFKEEFGYIPSEYLKRLKRLEREIRDKQPLPISWNADSYFSSSSIFFIFSSVLPASMEGNT